MSPLLEMPFTAITGMKGKGSSSGTSPSQKKGSPQLFQFPSLELKHLSRNLDLKSILPANCEDRRYLLRWGPNSWRARACALHIKDSPSFLLKLHHFPEKKSHDSLGQSGLPPV